MRSLIVTHNIGHSVLEGFENRFAPVVLEDRALPEHRTWTSDDIQIEAHTVSTLRNDGTVIASSITAALFE